MTTEYFIFSNSFAAPFFSDTGERFIEADSPAAAMQKFVDEYKHPAGLYFAALHPDANAYHKREDPILVYVSNHEIGKIEATRGREGYSYYGDSPGKFEISGETVTVDDPLEGRIMTWKELEEIRK